MFDTLKKAFWLFTHRPLAFLQQLRGATLFWLVRIFGPLVYRPATGVFLGPNSRIQSLACLEAERPHARIDIGEDCIVYENARLRAYGRGQIQVGAGSILGDVRIDARLKIHFGQRVLTSWNVFLQDFDSHPVSPELRAVQMRRMTENFRPRFRAIRPVPNLDWDFPSAEIHIGDDVWLGANVTILKGARIGAGSIVSAGSVVLAGNYPERSLLAGVPAQVRTSLSKEGPR
jgi:acetyltransferase-like isoleucine patch superfamily enzyme